MVQFPEQVDLLQESLTFSLIVAFCQVHDLTCKLLHGGNIFRKEDLAVLATSQTTVGDVITIFEELASVSVYQSDQDNVLTRLSSLCMSPNFAV